MTRPQELVEVALAASRSDDCVVIVRAGSSANLRWAANTLTTNGVMQHSSVTVVAFSDSPRGRSAGSVSGTAATSEQVARLVEQADAAAARCAPATDAAPLVGGRVDPDWDESPGETSIAVYADLAPTLGAAFDRADAEGRLLYGFVDHATITTYLGSSTGLRLRHVEPVGHWGCTGKSSDLGASAWVGGATRDFRDVDALDMDAALARRLAWATRTVEVPAGRHDTVLPPTAVADLMIYAYWTAGAQAAHDGRTVFGLPGGGTRIGERLSSRPVHLLSDPRYPGLETTPFVVASASTETSSVFDNGVPLRRTHWVRDGVLEALVQTRESASTTGQPLTPGIGNLVVEVDGATGSTEDLVAGMERGLLVTCLWYIREVDPQTLLLTGLTRDGVYLVDGGEIVGAVTNFRFNESPVDLLDRFTAASATVPSFSREWGDEFPLTATPALRVPDFNMSTISPAQ